MAYIGIADNSQHIFLMPPSSVGIINTWRGVECHYMMQLNANCKNGTTTKNMALVS